jgi:hypothetical protein
MMSARRAKEVDVTYDEVAEKWGLSVEEVVDLKESMLLVWSMIEDECKGVDPTDLNGVWVVAEVMGESRLYTLGPDPETANMIYAQPWPVAIGIDVWRASGD